MTRPRACGVLIDCGQILMVQHAEPTRSYWTLPGGGVELGESPSEAAAREVWEETGLRVKTERLLFESTYGDLDSPEYYFLMALESDSMNRQGTTPTVILGHDPEETHLAPDQRLLQGVGWHSLMEMQGDPQISAVLRALFVPRPGSYAVILDVLGQIAVMETPRGCFLPGGGSEGEETPEETLLREVNEECGFSISIDRKIGEAVEYVYTSGNEQGIRKECIFFQATVTGSSGVTEAGHILIWLKPQDALGKLVHGSQRWAVSEVLG